MKKNDKGRIKTESSQERILNEPSEGFVRYEVDSKKEKQSSHMIASMKVAEIIKSSKSSKNIKSKQEDMIGSQPYQSVDYADSIEPMIMDPTRPEDGDNTPVKNNKAIYGVPSGKTTTIPLFNEKSLANAKNRHS